MNKTQKEVVYILEHSQEARDSDTQLLFLYAKDRGYSEDVLYFIGKEETFIKNFIRVRAKLQREGKYLASPLVRAKREKHRKIKANEMRTPLVVQTNLTETQINDIRRQGMYLPVTEVTGSKVEEKLMEFCPDCKKLVPITIYNKEAGLSCCDLCGQFTQKGIKYYLKEKEMKPGFFNGLLRLWK